MLQITIPEREFFNEATGEFVNIKTTVLQLEHSLISLSKWESKWKKPFLRSEEPLATEEQIDYVRCMTINNVPEDTYLGIGMKELKMIQEYISDSHTATIINDRRQTRSRSSEFITSELIYYWMIACGIPFECQKWHLNRLLTLIKICNIKQGPEQKMSRQSIYAQNRALNEARRSQLHSRG